LKFILLRIKIRSTSFLILCSFLFNTEQSNRPQATAGEEEGVASDEEDHARARRMKRVRMRTSLLLELEGRKGLEY